MREREKKSSKGGSDFFVQFTYDPFVAGTMGQPSHLERVIFWTKVSFPIFEKELFLQACNSLQFILKRTDF